MSAIADSLVALKDQEKFGDDDDDMLDSDGE